MNSRNKELSKIFFAFTDLSALCLIHLILLLFLDFINNDNEHSNIIFFTINNLIWLISSYITSLYINDKVLDFEKFCKRTGRAFILHLVLILTFIFAFNFDYSRIFITSSFGIFLIYLITSRVIFLIVATIANYRQRQTNKLVFLGYNNASKKLTSHFSLSHNNITVKGFFNDEEIDYEELEIPLLGKIKDCLPYAIENGITEIYSTISPEKNLYIYELAQEADKACIRFRFIPDLSSFIDRSIYLDYLEDIPVLSLRSLPLEDLTGILRKRLFDIIFSVFVIVFILSWLVPIVALLIKLDSKGPVFFIQERSGHNNRTFRCLKFRSLKINKQSDETQVTRDDNRLTKLGRFLRKSSIDELPQFFNVLKGEMSVVGPRPHMLLHTENYSKMSIQYMIRHFIKPGITGWAQVNGFRGEIKEEKHLLKRIEHDLWYVENWRLWLDFHIIILTIVVTLKGDKNAF